MAANWKMNLSIEEMDFYFNKLEDHMGDPWSSFLSDFEVAFAVPFTFLSSARKVSERVGIHVAAQNVHWDKNGAYTGEISCAMLKELGISWVLIGHSERRQFFNETVSSSVKKVCTCLHHDFTPILCVGEKKEERQDGLTENVLRAQLEPVFAEIEDPKNLIIAYEPVWAIGTGLAATAEQANEAHGFIKKLLVEKYGSRGGDHRILYGGSMKPENSQELLEKPFIDGGLIGGASLKPEAFAQMLKTMRATVRGER